MIENFSCSTFILGPTVLSRGLMYMFHIRALRCCLCVCRYVNFYIFKKSGLTLVPALLMQAKVQHLTSMLHVCTQDCIESLSSSASGGGRLSF